MVVVAALVVGSCAAWGQDPEFVQPAPAVQPPTVGQPTAVVQPAPMPVQAANGDAQPAAASAVGTADPAAAGAPAKKTFVVPAGTKVLLQLRSSVNTKSAKAGDGVYLASTFPVVVT